MSRAVIILALALAGCTDDTDPPWQLSHDRIIAIRASQPQIPAGAHAVIDGLIGSHGAPVAERSPDSVTVVSPAELTNTVSHTTDGWIVTAPSEDQLAAARGTLRLATGAPVPLVIDAGYGDLHATKTITLGGPATDNPTLPAVTINASEAPAAGTEIVIAPLTDIPLDVALSDLDFDVNWLTSCGTMRDFDLPAGIVHVEADDPHAGELALVVRDSHGGVTWRIWPLRAE